MAKKVSFKVVWSDNSLQTFHLNHALMSPEARAKFLSFPVDNHPFGLAFPNVKAPLLLFYLEGIVHRANSPLILSGDIIDLEGKKHRATIEYDLLTFTGQGEVEVEKEETVPAKDAVTENKEEIGDRFTGRGY